MNFAPHKLFILIFIFLFLSISMAYSQDELVVHNSVTFVEKYFSNLKSGNASQLANMLTGPYLAGKKQMLLSNPDYGDFLKKVNVDTEYEVVDIYSISENKVGIDLNVGKASSVQKIQMVLIKEDRTLKLYDERVLP